jgi:DNA helicase-2/ATP-dependent DNA helicase PcrA
LTRAEKRLILTSALRRRLFGEYQATEPSRFLDEVPPELIEDVSVQSGGTFGQGFGRHIGSQTRPQRSSWSGGRDSEPVYAYADEDQSAVGGLRPGVRVRHAQFGVGTVLNVEQLEDDSKLLVRFVSVGQKTLRAKYAKLELVG